MQDIGGKEDTELSEEDLTLSYLELSVECLGHCQSVGLHWCLRNLLWNLVLLG